MQLDLSRDIPTILYRRALSHQIPPGLLTCALVLPEDAIITATAGEVLALILVQRLQPCSKIRDNCPTESTLLNLLFL